MKFDDVVAFVAKWAWTIWNWPLVRLFFTLLLVGSAFYVGAIHAMGFSAVVLIERTELFGLLATNVTSAIVLVAVVGAMLNMAYFWASERFENLPGLPELLARLKQNDGPVSKRRKFVWLTIATIGVIVGNAGLLTLDPVAFSPHSIALTLIGMLTLLVVIARVRRVAAIVALTTFMIPLAFVLGTQWIAYLRTEAPRVELTLVDQPNESISFSLAMQGSEGVLGFVWGDDATVYVPWSEIKRIRIPVTRPDGPNLRFWEWNLFGGSDEAKPATTD